MGVVEVKQHAYLTAILPSKLVIFTFRQLYPHSEILPVPLYMRKALSLSAKQNKPSIVTPQEAPYYIPPPNNE
jgi:hypothetical protein